MKDCDGRVGVSWQTMMAVILALVGIFTAGGKIYGDVEHELGVLSCKQAKP